MSTTESESERKGTTKLDLDKVLVEEIGEFGIFQIKIIAQCMFAVIFIAWNINEFVFTTGRIQTRCLIPECEDAVQTVFAPTWISNAIPSNGGTVDNCQRFGNTSVPWLNINNSCPAALFDSKVLQQCEEYVYENTNTVVYDFNLACDEWRRSMVGSVRILGMMAALAITGYISDRWGRRLSFAMTAFGAAVLGVARYWAPSYMAYVLIMFMESVVGLGSYTCAWVLMVELLGPKYRVMGGTIINITFAVGQMILGLIAWAVTDWRSLILALYIPQFVSIFYFWTLPESIRWLMSKGKFGEAEHLLKVAARVNGKELSQKSSEYLRDSAQKEKIAKTEADDKPALVLLVLKDKRILMRCFVSCMWWITMTFVYYGLSINAVNLTGNMYLNYVTVTAVEIPGYWAAVLVIDRIGRKPTLIGSVWLCAACQVAFIFISNDLVTLSLIIYMLGKWAIAVMVTAVNIYTLELYPTECRHRLYSFSSMIGRLGSIAAPLTPALGATVFTDLPYVLFGGMAFLAGLLTFLVPETLGSKLADTMEEALDIEHETNTRKTTR